MIQRRVKGGRPKRLPAAVLWAGVLLSALILVGVQFQVVQVHPNLRRGTALAQSAARRRLSTLRRPIEYLREHAEREAPGYPEECRQRYHGLPFLQTMLDAWRQPTCAPQGAGPLNSSLSCWFQFDKYAEAYCTGANLALDLAKFAEEEAGIPRQSSNRNAEGYFVTYKRPGLAGELLGDCRLEARQNGEDMWKAESFGNGGQQWLFNSFKSVPGAPTEEQPVCVGWVSHPLYFLNDKYDSLNVWHALEDVTHAFEAWALKGWGQEAQIVVLDQVSPEGVLGPTYLPVWLRAFSSPARPPVLLRTLAEGAIAAARAANRGQLPPRAALCFRDAFFSVHGGISLLSRSISGWTPCKNSTTVNALVAFMLDGLQLADVRPASHEAAEAQRRRGDQPQQQGGPLTEGGGGGGGGQGLRVVWALRSTRAGMQAEVLQALQQRIPQETGAQVSAVEFGGLSIEEQVRRARQADVLVGYHGAALTLALFMHPQSALVEIESSFRCTCYTNCALWRDHPYALIHEGEWASEDGSAAKLADEVVNQVKGALEQVQRRLRGD